MLTTVHVSNISHNTSEQEVRDFFSFCGKITNLILTPSSSGSNATLSATVTYEREPAAKTALLLDGTKLGTNPVHVESTHSIDEIAVGHLARGDADEEHKDTVQQEDKPKTAILAEYLSHGYAIGDSALQKGIELDSKHGISSRFISTLNSTLAALDSRVHATDTAKSVDHQYHVTDRALGAKHTLTTYFEKALGTPTGQRIRTFYEQGGKSLMDIHNEARRLAELRKQQNRKSSEEPLVGPEKTTCACGGNEGVCTCEPGKCACARCDMAKRETKGDSAQHQFGEAARYVAGAAKDYSTGSQEKSTHA
ncbi:hypothetical protein L873DRAFT_1817400 [Choiromyces venosus 120613-1]|uniref:RRM domain-containing protein n=1 Tax=Choiromyces venosus 120613-1 TaxID=1336337 RepID=A0A3N4J2P9_9PEZI|nr:hypothetical protein L873DRAFT_1817400 [Choiromyces venosus 120613-1]